MTTDDIGFDMNMDPADKSIDYIFYDFAQASPVYYGYVGRQFKVVGSNAADPGRGRDDF